MVHENGILTYRRRSYPHRAKGGKTFYFEDVTLKPRLTYKQACRLALRRLSGAGNNPMVGMTVAAPIAIEEASK